MSVPLRHHARQRRQESAIRLAARTAAFTAVWAILGGGRGWLVGIPVILVAAAASIFMSSPGHWSFVGLLRFIPYFAWNSLRGAVDVAVRALHPGLPIDPGILNYELRLENAAARVVMANTVTLLPGTLSTELRGKVLVVHALNASAHVEEMLHALERRVADLFGEHDPARLQ